MNSKRKPLRQSGAIPFIEEKGVLKVMLVSPRRGSGWIIPKGNIAKGFSSCESAAKEAFEEAGVKGACRHKTMGEYNYRKKGGGRIYKVEVFPMRIDKVCRKWPEANERKRRLFKLEKAIESVREKKLKLMLERIPRLRPSGYLKAIESVREKKLKLMLERIPRLRPSGYLWD